ncbi:MAG TPA: Rrf2 family transcriptional regulator [Opitutales bacterium]|jgi:Rrf2 family protein|nr:Rrf2 family transcriptional regulator [Opitutales bacterium]
MATNTQFSIAVHLMVGLGYQAGGDITSARLAESVNASPSFVRRTLAKLSKADLIHTATGKAGACWLARNPREISLLDIYRAVEAPKAFAIHHYSAQKCCPVSCKIKTALESVLGQTQNALEASLAKSTLAGVIANLKQA